MSWCTGMGNARAHPRSRGDHSGARSSMARITGSSPLARGPQGVSFCPVLGEGLIPARAGTTAVVGTANQVVGAHPRSRGDHLGVVLQS